MSGRIAIQWRFTNELTETDIQQFIIVYTNVYGEDVNLEKKFEKKYLANIYGASLILFGFINDECVAIQSFLRNDLDGKKAYQSGDSATMKIARGKGIFSLLVKKGVELLSQDSVIYGFPNENSLPIFRKMGWTIGIRKKTGLFLKKQNGKALEEIDSDYAEWLSQGSKNLFYYPADEGVYLLKRKKFNVYQILGRLKISTLSADKMGLMRARIPILFCHKDNGKLGKGIVPIAWREKDLQLVRLYKLDVLITE